MRLTFDAYALRVCETIALRSTCDRARVGAIIIKHGQILGTGYNGSPKGMPHCDDVGHELELDKDGEEHCIRTAHAEANALLQAGRGANGAELFCTMTPCYTCAKLLVNAGIGRVTAINDYHAAIRSKALLTAKGIPLTIVTKPLHDPTTSTF